MVYIVANPGHPQVEAMQPDGTPQYEEAQVDTSYLQALAGDKEAQAATSQADHKPNPQPAIEAFTQALGECDVVVDLIQNLELMKYMDFKMMNNKPRSAHAAMQQMTASRMGRAARQRAALGDAAARLRAGAQSLRLVAAQDNAFHAQVMQLQHYWSIRRTPPTMGLGPDAPYLVDLTLGSLISQARSSTAGNSGPAAGQAQAAGAGAGATGVKGQAAEASGPSVLSQMVEGLSAVPLLRGPQGQLRVQLPRLQQVQLTNSSSNALQATAGAKKEEPGSQPAAAAPAAAAAAPAAASAAPSDAGAAPAAAQQEAEKGATRRSSKGGGITVRIKTSKGSITAAQQAAATGTMATGAQAAAAAAAPPGPVLSISVTGSEQQEVFAGLHGVHGALLSRQQHLMWGVLLDTLQQECAASVSAGGGYNFMSRLVQLLAELLSHSQASPPGGLRATALSRSHSEHHHASPPTTSHAPSCTPQAAAADNLLGAMPMDSSPAPQPAGPVHDSRGSGGGSGSLSLADPLLSSLRPVLLEHCLLVRLAAPLLSVHRGAQSSSAHLHRLLHDCVAILSHACSRASVWRALSQQVVHHPDVSLHWVSSSRMCTSALRVESGPLDSCLVIIQDQTVEIDGVLCGDSAGTRWGGDGHTTVTRHELPHLLPVVILGLPPAQV